MTLVLTTCLVMALAGVVAGIIEGYLTSPHSRHKTTLK